MFTHQDCGSPSHSALDPHQELLAFHGLDRQLEIACRARRRDSESLSLPVDITGAVAGMGPHVELEARSARRQVAGYAQANCQRKAFEAFGTIGRVGGPFRFGASWRERPPRATSEHPDFGCADAQQHQGRRFAAIPPTPLLNLERYRGANVPRADRWSPAPSLDNAPPDFCALSKFHCQL